MTPERWNDRDPAPRARARRALRQVWWASIPVWSIGLLSFVPFLAFAVMRRGKRDWAVFAAYLTSADELCAYTQLTPDRVDELRDLMIFT